MSDLTGIGEKAKLASRTLACTERALRDQALLAIASSLRANTKEILCANDQDMENGAAAGLSGALLDRLKLTEARIEGIAAAVEEVTKLPDPLGRILSDSTRENGLHIIKTTVPLGVIAVIYEARPNVTADSASLCLKSGNAVILRGGKEAIHSNIAIAETMRDAISGVGLPADCIQLIEDTTRASAEALMKLNKYVDVLIPRGGAGLIKSVVQNSTVPVIETGSGVCHVYVDRAADIDMAVNIIFNAKTSRPSVCNACECMLIHKDIASDALPRIAKVLLTKNVRIRGDERTCAILPFAEKATAEDWGMEYLDYIIAGRVVSGIDEAIEHIYRYGTGHSECIVSRDQAACEKFLKSVDAAAVYCNASTRFTDGGEFGLGAEIGISTQKLHARGPLGLNELTSSKYMVYGNGQVR